MEEGKVFHELSRGLPEEERKQLLERIRKSIQVDQGDLEGSESSTELDPEEREKTIEADIAKEGVLSRVLLWLLSKLSGKSQPELFLSKRLKQLKKSILRQNADLKGLDSKTISGQCGYEFFRLYLSSIRLKDVVQKLFVKPENFERGILRVIERELPETKHSVKDLVPLQALEETYLRTGMKSSLREEVLNAIDGYIATIPREVFSSIEEGIVPILQIKEIVMYPYLSLFKLFQFVPAAGTIADASSFRSASAYITMEYLKRMYNALTIASRLRNPIVLHDDFLTYMAELCRAEQTEAKADDDEIDAVEAQKNRIVAELPGLVSAMMEFSRKVPLRDLIRFYTQDPYYTSSAEMPQLFLREFYQSVLRIRFSDEIDYLFPEIQRLYIEKKIEHIFKGRLLSNFLNYREYTSIDYKKLGLPFFMHTKSLTLIHNFIIIYFRENVQELIRILGRGILAQSRSIMDRLILHSTALEDIEEKITAFDYSLSPDAEDGKIFQRLRFSLATDASQQRIYRSIVLQKDKEVKDFIERSTESLQGLSKVLHEILTSTGKAVQAQLSSHYLIKGKAVAMRDVIQERLVIIDEFRKLLDLVLRIERG